MSGVRGNPPIFLTWGEGITETQWTGYDDAVTPMIDNPLTAQLMVIRLRYWADQIERNLRDGI